MAHRKRRAARAAVERQVDTVLRAMRYGSVLRVSTHGDRAHGPPRTITAKTVWGASLVITTYTPVSPQVLVALLRRRLVAPERGPELLLRRRGPKGDIWRSTYYLRGDAATRRRPRA